MSEPDAESMRPLPAGSQLVDLVAMQLSNLRWAWSALVLTGCLTPLVSMLGMSLFARADAASLPQIFCGNLVVALLFANLNSVAANFSFMRFQGGLEFFATLPIRRGLLVAATVIAFFVLSMPGLLLTLLLGSRLLHLHLAVSPLVVLVVPLCVLPISGIGAVLGSRAGAPERTSALSLSVTLLLSAAGPVVVPPDRLAGPVRLAGMFNPAAYAASALRQVLLGPVTARLALDAAVLLAMGALMFGVLVRAVRWHRT
jgi:ABC-2 type transport system permease protein